jgi:ribosomal protein L37AE/L43A
VNSEIFHFAAHQYRGFPIPVAPQAHESLVSYLMRLTSANHYPVLNSIPGLFGINPSSSGQNVSKLWRLSQLLGNEITDCADRLTEMAHRPASGRADCVYLSPGQTIRVEHLESMANRYCPECVGETGIFLRLWEIRALTACPRHGTRLLNACPVCHKPLRLLRTTVAHCGECGSDLAQGCAAPASENAVSLSRLIAAKADGPCSPWSVHSFARPIKKMSLVDLLNAVEVLYRFHLNRTCKPHHLREPEVAELVTPILLGWPDTYHDYLRDCHKARLRREATSESGIQKSFGNLYFVLTNNARSDSLKGLLKETKRFVGLEAIRLGATARGRSKVFDPNQAGYLTKAQTCARLSIGRREFDRRVADGTFRDELLWFGKQCIHRVPLADVEAYEQKQRAAKDI